MFNIQLAQPKQISSIHELILKAYTNPSQAELVSKLRKANYYDKELALTALKDEQLVGHILFTRVAIKNGKQTYPALVLTSCAVDPDFQNQGIGHQLMLEGLKKCKYLGYRLVFAPIPNAYLKKFSFEPINEEDITLATGYNAPSPLVYNLSPQEVAIKGELYYPSEFGNKL